MSTLYVVKQIEVEITAEDAATAFCDMDSEEQARFFNHIADLVLDWKGTFPGQMQHLSEEPGLTLAARQIMSTIGAYAEMS